MATGTVKRTIDQLVFPLTMDMLGQNYVLKGMVQCVSHHITVAIKDGTPWVYVDMLMICVIQSKITPHAGFFS